MIHIGKAVGESAHRTTYLLEPMAFQTIKSGLEIIEDNGISAQTPSVKPSNHEFRVYVRQALEYECHLPKRVDSFRQARSMNDVSDGEDVEDDETDGKQHCTQKYTKAW